MASETLVYVGSYSQASAPGIHVYRQDPKTGDLHPLSAVGGIDNPSFLAIAPGGRVLCAVAEISQFGGQPAGAVASFAIDPASGSLRLLNMQSTVGTGPCHISIDATGRCALVANYGGGSVAVLPIGADGRLSPASAFVQHQGSSVNPQRQEGPHAHSINLSPDNRFAFAPDLGLDQILVYQLTPATGKLVSAAPPFAAVEPGTGPRHFTFHPNGRYAYVINEMGNTVTAFSYAAATGGLTRIQDISSLPAGYAEVSYTADIHLHPSGRFLYGSNRGHDSIAIFAVDPATGHLTPAGYEPTQGDNPRNFALDPDGAYLYAANGSSDTIVAFRIDPGTGQLRATGHVTKVERPVCVKMLRR
ncbi:MAG: lactonase family protein [Gemmatimonadota bacterium]